MFLRSTLKVVYGNLRQTHADHSGHVSTVLYMESTSNAWARYCRRTPFSVVLNISLKLAPISPVVAAHPYGIRMNSP